MVLGNEFKDLREIEVKIPHRITGFFQMMDPNHQSSNDPLKIGSRGGGPALTAMAHTKLELTYYQKNNYKYEIFINGIDYTKKAITSIQTLKLMEKYIPKYTKIRVRHDFELPMGAGYGSSGAGSLGIALGLKRLLGLPMSDLESSKYAHIAEVLSHTGLGTVGGQFIGGLSILLEPGFPYHYKTIPVDDSIRIIIGSFGPISTKSILTDDLYRKLIYQIGKKAMRMMQKKFTLENYLKICKFFLDETKLLKRLQLDDVQALLDELDKNSILGASMNQLGKSVFCFCKKQHVSSIKKTFQQFDDLKFVKDIGVFELPLPKGRGFVG